MKCTRIISGNLTPAIGFPFWIILCAVTYLPCTQTSTARADDPATTAVTVAADEAKSEEKDRKVDESGWKPVTGKWEISRYGGEGETEISGELIKLGFGDPLTGVRWSGEYPKNNYELRLEARRTDGFDFFVAVTFPVDDQHCSLVLGGWGGGVTGISNIDGQDASSNETTIFKTYKNDQWYKVRIRVRPETLMCFVDGRVIVDIDREGHEFDIRAEMDPALPLGLANFQCDSEIRSVQIRELKVEAETPDSATSSAADNGSEAKSAGE